MNELYHYGVIGMHWGVRRYQPYGSGGYTPKDKAHSVYRMAKKKEPKITRDVQDSLKKAGAKSYGLQHRIKTVDSIERKIDKDMKEEGIELDVAAGKIKDAVRYTSIANDQNFVDSYNRFKDDMHQKGYDEVRCKNFFEDYKAGKVKHKSVQSVFQDKDGYQFEVQFQTPSSQHAKDLKIPIYEERRKIGISKERAMELERQMTDLAEQVPYPKGIETIKSHNSSMKNYEQKTYSRNGVEINLQKQPTPMLAKAISKVSPKARDNIQRGTFLDIKVNDKKVGEVELHQESANTVNCVWMGVNSKERGQGYATSVLQAVCSAAKEQGNKYVTLEVPGNAPDARHIYEKIGFKEVGIVTTKEEDPYWNGLTAMRLDLSKYNT